MNEQRNGLPIGLGWLRRGEALVDFTDQYGEKRTIHRLKGSTLAVKRVGNTPALAMGRAAAVLMGLRIRAARQAAGMSLADLCMRAGLSAAPGHHKHRMYEIEKGARRLGVQIGTLYAIALALDVPVSDLLPSVDEIAKAADVAFTASDSAAVRMVQP